LILIDSILHYVITKKSIDYYDLWLQAPGNDFFWDAIAANQLKRVWRMVQRIVTILGREERLHEELVTPLYPMKLPSFINSV